MPDEWFHEEPEQDSTEQRSFTGHRRPWWNFHVVPLFLALFPLVYVHHLLNVSRAVVFLLCFVIFLAWGLVGIVGQARHGILGERHSVLGFGMSKQSLALAAALIASHLAAHLVLGLFGTGLYTTGLLRFLVYISPDLPVFIALAFGFALLFDRRKEHPEVWKLASVGLGGMMLMAFVEPVFIFSSYWSSTVFPTSSFWASLYLVKGIIRGLVEAVCWMLIVLAILAGRQTSSDNIFGQELHEEDGQ